MSTRATRAASCGVITASLAASMLTGSPAPAHASVGEPRVNAIDCLRSCAAGGQARGGSLVLLRGRGLGRVFRAVFPGGEGGARNLRGTARVASASSVRVRLPWETVSGRFVVGTTDGYVSRPAPISIAPIPVVSRTRCLTRCGPRRRARAGSLVLVRGVRLANVAFAVLYGRRGRADDRRARVGDQGFSSFRMRVPQGAASGKFTAREAGRIRSPVRRISLVATPGADPAGAFPVGGTHDYGGAGARFGVGRAGHRHQGQDVFARCGTPLVAARAGRVRYAGYQAAAAGHYIVIDGTLPAIDYVYMHLRAPALFRTGAAVPAGARIGDVGESGNARGCHVHFELWSSPGWYAGGRPFDPLPQLRAWDRRL